MAARSANRPSKRSLRMMAVPLILLAVVAGLIFVLFGQAKVSDEDQILTILTRIREGAGRQDVTEAAGDLSPDFNFHGLNNRQVRLEMMQFFRQNDSVSLMFNIPQQFSVSGDHATMLVYVELSARSENAPQSHTLYKGTIRLNFEREASRRLLIIPDHVWRITSAEVPNAPGADTGP